MDLRLILAHGCPKIAAGKDVYDLPRVYLAMQALNADMPTARLPRAFNEA